MMQNCSKPFGVMEEQSNWSRLLPASSTSSSSWDCLHHLKTFSKVEKQKMCCNCGLFPSLMSSSVLLPSSVWNCRTPLLHCGASLKSQHFTRSYTFRMFSVWFWLFFLPQKGSLMRTFFEFRSFIVWFLVFSSFTNPSSFRKMNGCKHRKNIGAICSLALSTFPHSCKYRRKFLKTKVNAAAFEFTTTDGSEIFYLAEIARWDSQQARKSVHGKMLASATFIGMNVLEIRL